MYVDDIKLAGKKQNLDPMWKLLDKEVDLGEPTSFLDHVYLGCTQRQCQISKDIVDNYRTMFESQVPRVGNFVSSWSWRVMQRNVWSDIVSWQTRRLNNIKVSTPCIDDHHFKEEEMKSVGELSQVCSHSKYLARIGYLMVSEQLARSRNGACDKRLNRFISNIHHTCGIALWVILQNMQAGLF